MRAFFFMGALSIAQGAFVPAKLSSDATLTRTAGWVYATAQVNAGEKEPAAWNTVTGSTTCAATSTAQSPIDIVTSGLVEDKTSGPVNGTGLNTDTTGTVVNDGRSVYWEPTDALKPFIMGGALTANKMFVLNHVEFHFGVDSTAGSEHTVDAKKYPLEMQMIHFDSALGTAASALAATTANNLAVVSILFEEDTTDNADLKPIIDALAMVAKEATGPLAIKKTAVKVNLMKLLTSEMFDDYYYYDGSWTQPTCAESVKWVVPTMKLKASAAQITAFRALKDINDKTLAPNNRPVQTLGTRKVNHVKKQPVKKSDQLGNAAAILGSTVLSLATFGGVYNALNQGGALGLGNTAKALKENPIVDFIEDFDQKYLRGRESQKQQQQQFQQQQFQQRY